MNTSGKLNKGRKSSTRKSRTQTIPRYQQVQLVVDKTSYANGLLTNPVEKDHPNTTSNSRNLWKISPTSEENGIIRVRECGWNPKSGPHW